MESNLKECSKRQETTIANALGWNVVSGSGSRSCKPGDVIGDRWLGECKTHAKDNHPILLTPRMWKKIKNEAMAKFKFPVLFGDDGSQQLENTWCVIPNILTIPNAYTEYIQEYPFDIKENLRFRNVDLKSFGISKDSGFSIFIINWADDICYLMTFTAFREIFC